MNLLSHQTHFNIHHIYRQRCQQRQCNILNCKVKKKMSTGDAEGLKDTELNHEMCVVELVTDSAEVIVGRILSEIIYNSCSQPRSSIISEFQVKLNTTKPKKFECDKCHKAFAQLTSAKKHCRNQDKSGICLICNVKISDRKNLKRHITKCHSKEKDEKTPDVILKCEECNITFAMKHKLKEHMRNKHGITEQEGGSEVKCSECEFVNKSESRVKAHFTLLHSNSTKRFSCESCDLVLKSKDGLLKHNKNNHSEAYPTPHSSDSQLNLPPDLHKCVAENTYSGQENSSHELEISQYGSTSSQHGLNSVHHGLESNHPGVASLHQGLESSHYGLDTTLSGLEEAHKPAATEAGIAMPASVCSSMADTDLARMLGSGRSRLVGSQDTASWDSSGEQRVCEDLASILNVYQIDPVPNVTMEKEISFWNM